MKHVPEIFTFEYANQNNQLIDRLIIYFPDCISVELCLRANRPDNSFHFQQS